jgi:hypothetical protein
MSTDAVVGCQRSTEKLEPDTLTPTGISHIHYCLALPERARDIKLQEHLTMDLPGYVFLITPPAGVDQGKFEKSLGESLREIAARFTQRQVIRTVHTLFKARDEKEATRYLWYLGLELVSADSVPFGSAFDGLVQDLNKAVASGGKASFVTAVDDRIVTRLS